MRYRIRPGSGPLFFPNCSSTFRVHSTYKSGVIEHVIYSHLNRVYAPKRRRGVSDKRIRRFSGIWRSQGQPTHGGFNARLDAIIRLMAECAFLTASTPAAICAWRLSHSSPSTPEFHMVPLSPAPTSVCSSTHSGASSHTQF